MNISNQSAFEKAKHIIKNQEGKDGVQKGEITYDDSEPDTFHVQFSGENHLPLWSTRINDAYKKEEIKRLNIHYKHSINGLKSNEKLENFVFHEAVILDPKHGTIFQFTNCQFEKSVKISGEYRSRRNFVNCVFKEKVEVDNCTTGELLDFSDSIFESTFSIKETTIPGALMLARCDFKKEVSFLFNQVEPKSYVSFEDSRFHKFLDVARSNLFCNIQFKGIDVKQDLLIKKTWASWFFGERDFGEVKELVDYQTESKHKTEWGSIAIIRASLEMVQHQLKSNGYLFEARRIKALTNHFYLEELRIDKTHLKDRVMLFLARMSNGFGINWVRGILFTFLSGGVLFLLLSAVLISQNEIELACSSDAILSTASYYFDFINVTKWKLSLYGLGDSPTVNISVYLSRIIVGFGVYQTISAFRGLGKSS